MVTRESCFENDSGEEVCKEFPAQECTVEATNEVITMPNTTCNSVPREICGPEVCPVVEGEEVCWDEIKAVSIKELLSRNKLDLSAFFEI